MKNNTERNKTIFTKWLKQGYSFKEIAQQSHTATLSLKRIRNIIYAGEQRTTSPQEKEIYQAYKQAYCDLKDRNRAIKHVYHNQAKKQTLSERQVRRIVQAQIHKNR